MTWVLDLSNHQASFDLGRAAGEGYSAVLCKATEGTTFRDGRFRQHVSGAMRAGMIPGAYHYLRAGDGAAQARAFHTAVSAAGGPAGWLIALDDEADASWATTQAWAAEWRRLTGGHPFLMYTGAWWWGSRGWPGATLTPYLWHSRYVTGSGSGSWLYGRVPTGWWSPGYGGWPQATLLQFTSQALVAGQRVDASAFRGSLDDLRQLTRPGGDLGMATVEQKLGAWLVGVDHVGDDEVTPVVWQQRMERWQADVSGRLQELQQRPGATVTLGAEELAALQAGIVAEVGSQVAPALAALRQLLDRLGAAGDALGALNDPEAR